jgi:N-alpha-acetyltransferase 50
MLYLSTVVVLSPYRSYGLASQMLDILIRRAADEYGVRSVGAHVWVANEDGLEWYRKRGFTDMGEEEGYYSRLKPSTAKVMQRDISVLDLVNG